MKWCLLLIGILPVILASCADNEMKQEKDAENIYATCVISGNEGDEFVTAVVQFYSGRLNGPGIALQEPSKIFLGERPFAADSARVGGVFYEIQVPVEEITGKHIIRFIGGNGKEYREEFEFIRLTLAEEVPDVVSKKNLVLLFRDLKDTPVRVVMMDTSINGQGVNEIDTIINNRLDLTKFSSMLTSGPVMLQLFTEQERRLESYNGEISVTNALKREFELKD